MSGNLENLSAAHFHSLPARRSNTSGAAFLTTHTHLAHLALPPWLPAHRIDATQGIRWRKECSHRRGARKTQHTRCMSGCGYGRCGGLFAICAAGARTHGGFNIPRADSTLRWLALTGGIQRCAGVQDERGGARDRSWKRYVSTQENGDIPDFSMFPSFAVAPPPL
jgi:hypothetical protein